MIQSELTTLSCQWLLTNGDVNSKFLFQGITMDEAMDVDNSGLMSNHQLVTVGSDGNHIVLGGSHPPTSIQVASKVEHQPRKIQPQVKLASKDSAAVTLGSSSFRIAPSSIQGKI